MDMHLTPREIDEVAHRQRADYHASVARADGLNYPEAVG